MPRVCSTRTRFRQNLDCSEREALPLTDLPHAVEGIEELSICLEEDRDIGGLGLGLASGLLAAFLLRRCHIYLLTIFEGICWVDDDAI